MESNSGLHLQIIPREEVVREKLRILTLPPKMWDTQCIQPIIRIYPNITELNLDIPSPDFLSLIFKHWTGLKRLVLSLLTLSSDSQMKI